MTRRRQADGGDTPFDALVRRVLDRQHSLRLTGLRGAARALVTARLAAAHGDRPVLVLVPDSKTADGFAGDLRAHLGEAESGGRVRTFPHHDVHPYERFSPQPFVVAQRMNVLYRWLASASGADVEPAPIAVAPWTALDLRVPSRETVRGKSVHLEIGQTLDRDALVEVLLSAGYQRMPLVEERGELAVRGHVIDLFPPHRERPIRVELLGDDVEQLREFDPASQRSEAPLAYVVAPPPREILFDRSLVIERGDAIRDLARQQGVADRAVDELLDALLRGHLPPGIEALAPLLQPSQETVFDFLPRDTLIVVDDPDAGRARLLRHAEELLENFDLARENGRVVAPPDRLTLGADTLLEAVGARHPVVLEHLVSDGLPSRGETIEVATGDHDELRRELLRARSDDAPLAPLVDRLARWQSTGWRTLLACRARSHAERLRHLLSEHGVSARITDAPHPEPRWSGRGRVEIRLVEISQGYSLGLEKLAVVGEEEIFGPREKRKVRKGWPEGAAVESLAHLQTGDYLVHADHGIGVYRGLVKLNLRGIEDEFLRLQYAEEARLFVPVHRLNLIQRYSGSDGHAPRIDRLGGQTWEKAKRGIKRALRNMAQQLLSVHAARELTSGFAFSPRDSLLEEFEAIFPFEETPDQLAAIEDTLADLQKPKPMDRLVCGDVGYGKTEVAVRAAFRAVMDGKQVAVLVPTTILCQQHEETFRKRFEAYPVVIESLSRFRTAAQARRVREGLLDGKVDIVIGTHRLLQKSVQYRDLGLLVVDEEHRFGVAHKERIKQLKKTVDVLTLTATPIPRTLQMAFTGARDLSVMETPPADRMAVRTQTCRFSESLVREAILRELRRGGQCFFVHNRVHSIGAVQKMLEKAVPEADIILAHGQMPERELEDRMLRFTHGEGDVLLCTTIIESGLDVQRANTILIDRADTLGLAQLYQLRGRVGRSNQRAYAYLLVPGEAALTSDAEKRLQAIQDLAALGSGFRLANLDLEIRGAGNLLGAEQSGNLAAVGYETYTEMLQETMDELRGKAVQHEVDPEIRLAVAARLPDDYVQDVSQRLVLYKRLASCREDLEIERLRDELLDRFGALPAEAENLMAVIRIKIRARRLGVAAIDQQNGELVFTAAEQSQVDPQRLLNLLKQAGRGLRVAPGHRIHAPAPKGGPRELFAATLNVLASLGAG
ncbi:MAG: transcription-repair coupling factor [Deltaproteobacteria bacterium]|nr:transcription-repair coupling factor [Deltaproteobacteria bacterium]MBW2360842.1 transcription-repair coupling factor [Deltaproteobacteria bacterium]